MAVPADWSDDWTHNTSTGRDGRNVCPTYPCRFAGTAAEVDAHLMEATGPRGDDWHLALPTAEVR